MYRPGWCESVKLRGLEAKQSIGIQGFRYPPKKLANPKPKINWCIRIVDMAVFRLQSLARIIEMGPTLMKMILFKKA